MLHRAVGHSPPRQIAADDGLHVPAAEERVRFEGGKIDRHRRMLLRPRLAALDAVFFDLAVQSRTPQAEQTSRFGDAIGSSLQGFLNQFPLPEVNPQGLQLLAGGRVAETQVVGQNDRSFAHYHGAVNHISQLPHIAGPAVTQQLLAGVGRKRKARPPVLLK